MAARINKNGRKNMIFSLNPDTIKNLDTLVVKGYRSYFVDKAISDALIREKEQLIALKVMKETKKQFAEGEIEGKVVGNNLVIPLVK